MNFSKLILSYYLVGFWNFNSEPLKREFIFKNEEKFIFSRKNLNAGVYVFELSDWKTTFALRKKIIVF